MKTGRILALATLIAVPGLLVSPQLANAQSKAPLPKIAVVDVNLLLRDAKAIKGARDQANTMKKKFEADYVSEAKRLQNEERELIKKQPVITGREFEGKRRDLARQFVNLRRKRQLQERLLNIGWRNVFQRFREEVVVVVKAIAVEEGYTLVLNSGTAIHATPQYDITSTVLTRVNKRLPKIEYKLPSPKPPAKAPTPQKKPARKPK